MNIFILDENPLKIAEYLCDKHIVKMSLESAQIMCSSFPSEIETPYKKFNPRHPCTKWAGESFANYAWLYMYASEICNEFEYRYNKMHSSYNIIKDLFHKASNLYYSEEHKNYPGLWTKEDLTPFCLCMPEDCKISKDPVECYREYYRKYKAHFAKWTGRDKPKWMDNK